MTKYLYITLLMVPALSHAMDKKPKTLASISADQGSHRSGSGRRSSLPNVLDFFRKKSSHVSKMSTGSLDLEHLDGSSLESATSPRATTPRSGGMARGTRSSDGKMSPRLNVAFDSVARVKDDDNNHTRYEIDTNGLPVPIFMGDIDEEEDSAPTSPSQYNVDRDYRKNPDFKNPKGRTCKSPDTLSDEAKKKVRDAEGQCPVGADAFGAPRVAQKVKYSAAKICTIVNNGAGSHAPQDSNVAYHIGAQNDDGDPAIVALAASAAAAERKANGLHENDDTLDHLIAMVQSASVVSKDDDE